MGFIKRLFSGGGKGVSGERRIFLLSLEGVSHILLTRLAQGGAMPNLAAILDQGDLARMNSVLPAVSTVAWASFATGMNPGKHGIYGLVDREPNPFSAFYPNSRDLKAPTLWEHLGRAGRKLGVMNVPVTYPPKQVNGFIVGCFLSPDLAKATYPVDLAPRLMELDYRIEPELGQYSGDMEGLMNEVGDTLARRFSAAFSLMKSEPWEYFHLHESSTDRVGHMLLAAWEEGDPDLAPEFEGFWRKLDGYLGELAQALPPGTRLIMMSEAGLMRTKAQIFVNHWLEKNGYLHFPRGKRELMSMHPDSKAYSLEPGRIYINREGREEQGRVPKGKPYEDLREELIHRLSGLTHPETGEALVRRVFKREELYAGAQLNRAADIVIDPMPGFDLKYSLDAPNLLVPQPAGATHGYEDAFLFMQNAKRLPEDNTFSILDLSPTLMTLLGLALPSGLDGQSLV